MRVNRGRAHIAAEKGEGVEKFFKSKTLKYAFSATLYQVFLKKIKIPSLPVVFFPLMLPPTDWPWY